MAGVFVPGTWETRPSADETRAVGLLGPVATELAQRFETRFEFRFPAYAAAAFDGMAYGDSKATGVAAARRVIIEYAQRCAATKFVLAGYSQGADAIGDVAAAIGCSADPVPADRILAVGLVADPHQGTEGGKLVGPAVDGQGIAGPRESGFCGVSAVTAQICAPQDKYCATSARANPILAKLGRVLSQPTSGEPERPGDETDLTRSLVTDLEGVDLAALPAAVANLVTAATRGPLDAVALSRAAAQVGTTLGPLSAWATQLLTSGGAQDSVKNPQVPQELVTGVSESDLLAARTALSELAGPDGTDPAEAANRLADSLAPLADSLTNSSPNGLAQASRVLGLAKPSALVGQVSNVLTHGLDLVTSLPAIVDTLTKLTNTIVDLNIVLPEKVSRLQHLFGELNNQFAPLVAMADGVDLGLLAKFVALIPDPTGVADVAALVVELLENLDIRALARQLGKLQEDLWGIAQTLTTGADPVQLATRVAALAPTMLGFAEIALNTLTGEKTNPSGGTASLAGSARALTESTGTQTADALAQLASEGLSAASFLASGVHQDYERHLVDGQRNTVAWLVDWFAGRIRHANGAL
ncbi:cutinase family protein [Nocardia sp. NPDC051832]|uniref:cutinase family protein n=1 Tax=Nocardia sp. NPDC051832 TaxID=3155673 RepID=UPI00342CDA6C